MRVRGETDVGPLLIEAARNMALSFGDRAILPDDLAWWSWPEVFPSTAGPRGGIGGHAMTTFQVFGFESHAGRLLYCAGQWCVWRWQEQRWRRPRG